MDDNVKAKINEFTDELIKKMTLLSKEYEGEKKNQAVDIVEKGDDLDEEEQKKKVQKIIAYNVCKAKQQCCADMQGHIYAVQHMFK